MKRMLMAFLLILAVMASPIFAFTPVTDCMKLNKSGETYVVTAGGFTNTDTLDSCLEVTADDIVLDCIDLTRVVNADSGRVLYVHNVKNFRLIGCNLTGGQYNAFMIFVNNSRITSLDVSGSTQYDGLYVETVLNSSFQNIYASYNTGRGISILDVFGSQFSEIISEHNSDNGILVDSSDGNTFRDVSCTSNSDNAFRLKSSSYNTFDDFVLDDTVAEGIMLILESDNNNFTDGIISDVTGHLSDGISLDTSDYNVFRRVNITGGDSSGIYLIDSDSNEFHSVGITSIVSNPTPFGIYNSNGEGNIFSSIRTYGTDFPDATAYFGGSGNALYDSILSTETSECVELGAGGNFFWNNLFNCSALVSITGVNDWNATKQSGSRIFSAGTQIGGNYWATESGDGYSEGCDDSNTDGFCDDAYYLGEAGNYDYLALSNGYAPTTTSTTLEEATTTSTTLEEAAPDGTATPIMFFVLNAIELAVVIGIVLFGINHLLSGEMSVQVVIGIIISLVVAIALLGVLAGVI